MGLFFKDGTLTSDGQIFEAFYKSIGEYEVDVGFNEKSGGYGEGDDYVTTAQVAAWNEVGTERAPSRPFMRQTLRNNEDEIKSKTKSCLKKAVEGKIGTEQALDQIGVYVKGKMQKEIRDGEFEPNAESTIQQKKSDRPLIDTGHMRQYVIYEVKKGGT